MFVTIMILTICINSVYYQSGEHFQTVMDGLENESYSSVS